MTTLLLTAPVPLLMLPAPAPILLLPAVASIATAVVRRIAAVAQRRAIRQRQVVYRHTMSADLTGNQIFKLSNALDEFMEATAAYLTAKDDVYDLRYGWQTFQQKMIDLRKGTGRRAAAKSVFTSGRIELAEKEEERVLRQGTEIMQRLRNRIGDYFGFYPDASAYTRTRIGFGFQFAGLLITEPKFLHDGVMLYKQVGNQWIPGKLAFSRDEAYAVARELETKCGATMALLA